uniref:Uncharacterized protein n=1 Tax=uncultured marine virus TaxID=186617 RepID=A0A0F7LAF2_9VIRU|nr:hypothetical protein [uncultured marine virus]
MIVRGTRSAFLPMTNRRPRRDRPAGRRISRRGIYRGRGGQTRRRRRSRSQSPPGCRRSRATARPAPSPRDRRRGESEFGQRRRRYFSSGRHK